MKAYILNEADFERLMLMLDRDPTYGHDGSTEALVRDDAEKDVWRRVHKFFRQQLHKWIDEVQR